jgi:hypothetical protein
VIDLKKKLHGMKKGLPVERQRITLQCKPEQNFSPGEVRGQVLEDDKRLSEYGLKHGDVVLFKDLGPQVNPGGRLTLTAIYVIL